MPQPSGRASQASGLVATDDLFEAVRHLPDQVRDAAVAAADVEGLPDREEISEVVIVGTGGGAVAGDVVESVAQLQGVLPVISVGAISPYWLKRSSLVIVVSQSGEDPLTLAALRAARQSGAAIVAVTAGGELMSLCSQWATPVMRVDPLAGPAAGLGVAIVPVLVLLERLGALSGMNRLISETADQLELRRALLDADPAAVQKIAAAVRGRVTVVCGAGGVGKHAARRWVQELDTVGGVASLRRNTPADADEAASWARLSESVPGGVAAVVLRHDFEPHRARGRVDLLEGAVSSLHEVSAAGDGALAQLLDLVLVGDAVASLVAADSAP